MQKGFSTVHILLLVAILVLAGFAYSSRSSTNNLNTNSTKQELNESLIFGKCHYDGPCSLKQIYPDGSEAEYLNKYNLTRDSKVFFSVDGNYLVYISQAEGLVIADLKNGSTKKLSVSLEAKLSDVYKDYFWFEDKGIHKLVSFDGNIKSTIDKSIFPRHYPDLEIYLSLSPLYSNNRILAISSTKMEGTGLRTAWEISDGKPRKLFDLHFNRTGVLPSIVSVTFFNTEPAFLVNSESESNAYKLTPDNQKTILIDEAVEGGPQGGGLLSYDDTELYYSLNLGGYSQSDKAGLYKLNLKTNSREQLIKGNNYNPTDQSSYFYQLLSISPSHRYLYFRNDIVSAQKATIYIPSILSLEDNNIKQLQNEGGKAGEGTKDFGWINQ